jgi:anti-sigma regulatory factor (Ser/Thr protein kinase)
MELGVVVESQPEAPARVRSWVNELAGHVTDRLLIDLRLALSELVANSVRHGPGGQIDVRVKVHARDLVTGEVSDDGDGHVAIREALDQDGGWGLRILDSVASSWGVVAGSTHVWFEIATIQD